MLVRRANTAEAEELARHHARIAEEGSIATEPPVDVAALAERFRATIERGDPDAMLVLDDDGRIAGYAGVQQPGPAGVLTFGMAVLPEARGRGGGRALMDAILEHARRVGAHKVELEVWPDNARAVSLYATSGFEVEGFRRDHYRRRDGSLRSALLMARLL